MQTTRLYKLSEQTASLGKRFGTAISLHCHTRHSKEILDFIPHYTLRVPVVAGLFRRSMEKFNEGREVAFDFKEAYWTPPLSARMVYEEERSQIENKVGLEAIVSITDHDDIEAGRQLQVLDASKQFPISLEWTVPYGIGFFHVGVHNLPPNQADDIMTLLMGYTESPKPQHLTTLFAMLNGLHEVLIVLNHPLWDIELIGKEKHNALLKDFLDQHGGWVHAFEVNGFRSWEENRAVLKMAQEMNCPVVSGGDRHGCQCNSVLNLSWAKSFAEFVHEVRFDKRSEVLLMPEYEEPLSSRQLECASEILRLYSGHPLGQRHWTDRIFVKLDSSGMKPLSFYWRRGGPKWVRFAVWTLRVLGSRRVRPAFRLGLLSEERISL
jgi:hypothetical protein